MRLKNWIFLIILAVLSFVVFTGCSNPKSSDSKESDSKSASQTQGNWWDKWGTPQYGGTLTIRNATMNPGSWDPIAGMVGAGGFASNLWLEGLAVPISTLDRKTWSYGVGFASPEYLQGHLVESWEQTDPSTINLYVRKGVKWQNKPPVNGRELVADDIVFNYDRALGTGHGYTRPDPMVASQFSAVDRAIATDKYTVQVKLKQPGVLGLYQILGGMFYIVPPEWVALGGPPSNEPAPAGPPGPPGPGQAPAAAGPLSDWKQIVGTGPYMVTDFQQGTSMTLSKNPDYWGYDERHPQNKLPYVDKVVQLAIPDGTTALAAMRTGKIDMWTDMMGAMTWQQGETLKKTNPEIQQAMLPRPAGALVLRNDTKPFNDIRVRKALQMALDLPTIAKSYYNDSEYAQPVGLISPELTGYTTPFKQWPQELKDEYSFNPEKAKQLLAEAGYPNGFKTNTVAASNLDTSILQVIKSQFKDIGVDLDIRMMDPMSYSSFVNSGKHDQMAFSDGLAGMGFAPVTSLSYRITGNQSNTTYNSDPTYDAMYEKINDASTVEELKKLSVEADMYGLKQHWSVNLVPSGTPVAWQPWVKGYSAEVLVDNSWAGAIRSRIWIDKSLKK